MRLKQLSDRMMKLFYSILLIVLIAPASFAQLKSSDDFKVKGFHIDLRIQVMTPQALRNFARELASFGINTLVMEWEASYPYDKHATISNKYAYTREEVKSFIDYCSQLGMDVIPLQQCFGHVEYILRNDRYSHLKEERKDISQICPLKTEGDSLLFSDLFKDLASTHPSKFIHIGGDETYLLGHCKDCSKKAAAVGKSKLFVDYMKMITQTIVKMGKTPIMWADILLKYPEAASELPKETIFIDWNYGWKTNHFGDISNVQAKGFTFWGSPSIRSHPDNWYVTEWEKHFNNQRDFIPYSRKAGYQGMVMTSWSTSGLYGFTWDSGYELVDMLQVRNNYPLSAFRILVASFAEALKTLDPINPEAFVKRYAEERFGLKENDRQRFWQAITTDPKQVVITRPDAVSEISGLRIKNDTARKILKELMPLRNQKEFEHYRLMFDLRGFYLDFKEIEAVYNSADFNRSKAKTLVPRLEKLRSASKTLDRRFYDLNKGFLHEEEIREQNLIRNQKLEVLFQRISRIR
ncbi:family 20 glycosylhydrolase [Flavihumibacter stibioxidans]|nr:family 20 glycosylhydrolase [Flavihumibacter stibioxidans]